MSVTRKPFAHPDPRWWLRAQPSTTVNGLDLFPECGHVRELHLDHGWFSPTAGLDAARGMACLCVIGRGSRTFLDPMTAASR